MQKQLKLWPEIHMVMNPDHRKWEEFVSTMNSLDHFGKIKGIIERNNLQLGCQHDTTFTELLLETYPDVDVPATLEYFKFWGGYCDCEVIANVVNRLGYDFKEQEQARRAYGERGKLTRWIRVRLWVSNLVSGVREFLKKNISVRGSI